MILRSVELRSVYEDFNVGITSIGTQLDYPAAEK